MVSTEFIIIDQTYVLWYFLPCLNAHLARVYLVGKAWERRSHTFIMFRFNEFEAVLKWLGFWERSNTFFVSTASLPHGHKIVSPYQNKNQTTATSVQSVARIYLFPLVLG